jgi:NAD+ synthase (glutamine-hydrolysing)
MNSAIVLWRRTGEQHRHKSRHVQEDRHTIIFTMSAISQNKRPRMGITAEEVQVQFVDTEEGVCSPVEGEDSAIEDKGNVVVHDTSIPMKDVHSLHSQLLSILQELRAKRGFNPALWTKRRTSELCVYLKRNNLRAVVVSISGGVDSASILGLLKRAQDLAALDPTHPFNPANGGKIIAIAQPICSTPGIQNRAYEAANAFDVNVVTVDQTSVHNQLVGIVENQVGPLQDFSKAMFKSYQRTPIAYLLASHYGGVVVGTGNLDEDGYLYYYCKFGDGAVDVGLIWDLHKSEVFQLAEYLGVPRSILEAPPSADLAPGQTDETEIGATYDMVELVYTFIHSFSEAQQAEFLHSLCPEARDQFDREREVITAIHNRGMHKADLNPKNMGSEWFKERYPEADI